MRLFARLFKPEQTIQKPTIQSAPTLTKKQCSKCHLTLPVTAFSRRLHSNDGFQFWCRACVKVQKTLKPKPSKKKTRKQFGMNIHYKNLDKARLQLNIPDVTQEQYRQLVGLAKARKWTMTRLYQQMVMDFLTLHIK